MYPLELELAPNPIGVIHKVHNTQQQCASSTTRWRRGDEPFDGLLLAELPPHPLTHFFFLLRWCVGWCRLARGTTQNRINRLRVGWWEHFCIDFWIGLQGFFFCWWVQPGTVTPTANRWISAPTVQLPRQGRLRCKCGVLLRYPACSTLTRSRSETCSAERTCPGPD